MIGNLYLWVKAFHIIAVISWMAGLLYLPRLFVYHASVHPDSESSRMLKLMEKKLLKYIMNPAMLLSFILGAWLMIITKAGAPGSGGWMHLKLVFVIILAALHGMMAKYRKDFERNQNTKSSRYYRIFNEIPAVAMVVVVLLVVLKPF